MIRNLSKYARATALGAISALALVAGSAQAGQFIAAPQDYPNATEYAQAYAKSAQAMRNGEFVGRCYAPNSGWGCGETTTAGKNALTAMDRKVATDGGNGSAGSANPAADR